jgi:hypothetical protein
LPGETTKAQFWSFDLVFAVVIFVSTIVLLTYVWLSISGQFSIAYSGNTQQLQEQLQNLGTSIVSQGYPPNWNYIETNSIPSAWSNLSIGLGNGTSGALSLQKIDALEAMSANDYQETKAPLGISYDYYITITGGNINAAMGSSPFTTNVFSLQTLELPVVINGYPAQVQIYLWSNSTLTIQ